MEIRFFFKQLVFKLFAFVWIAPVLGPVLHERREEPHEDDHPVPGAEQHDGDALSKNKQQNKTKHT